ncbi:hypothetical protein [Actinoplanes auranticolor]|uniref:Uncharacterized protein n=1 Tax=Actinoplanes auranticolor TaxID=47988 RepID=A0A919S8V9_9ACTN|nr:hypothetical protein [Actinoplanes auranticolor]GIM67192.1 hypothetical protein Aau02nite_26320 [Actinoplanes auranticolor]
MRIRTALSAAVVSLAAVTALFVAGPGPAERPEAAEPLVIVLEQDHDTPAYAADRPALHGGSSSWECDEV